MVRRNVIMIKATDSQFEKNENGQRQVLATLVADTSDEVIAHGASGEGILYLQPNDVMTFGSTCLCVDGKFGMLNSSGVWEFK